MVIIFSKRNNYAKKQLIKWGGKKFIWFFCIAWEYISIRLSSRWKCDPYFVPVFAACHGLLVWDWRIRVTGSVWVFLARIARQWSVCVAWELSYSSSLWWLLSLKCYWFKFNPSSVGLSPNSSWDIVWGDIRCPGARIWGKWILKNYYQYSSGATNSLGLLF